MAETPPPIRRLPNITEAHQAYYDLMSASPKTQTSQEQMAREVQALFKKGLKANGRDKFDNPPLSLAARFGYIYVVDLLLKKGADPAATDAEERTALEIIDALFKKAITGEEIYNEGTLGFCKQSISAALQDST